MIKGIIKRAVSFLLNKNILFSLIIQLKPSCLTLVYKHQFFNYYLKNQFYNKVFIRLNSEYNIDRKLVFNGFYDIKTLLLLKRFLRKGDVYLDVGANIGSIAFAAATYVGNTGTIICFEPGFILFQSLSKSVKLNKFKNFKLFNCGCSNENGYLKWTFDEYNPGNAKLSNSATDTDVRVVKIDDVIFEDQEVHFIKIDVEGMELNVLQGAIKIIQNKRPLILIETNTDSESERKTTEQTLQYLTALNYNFFAVKDKEEELSIYFKGIVEVMPVKFPHVPQNTLAIPYQRLSEFNLQNNLMLN